MRVIAIEWTVSAVLLVATLVVMGQCRSHSGTLSTSSSVSVTLTEEVTASTSATLSPSITVSASPSREQSSSAGSSTYDLTASYSNSATVSPSLTSASLSKVSFSAAATSTRSASGSTVSASLVSQTITASVSKWTVAPWIHAVDGVSTPLRQPTQRLLASPSTVSFSLTVGATTASELYGYRTLTLSTTPLDLSNPWTQRCGVGMPSLNATFSLGSSTQFRLTVSVELQYAAIIAAFPSLQGDRQYPVCTSDGYFSGVTLLVISSASSVELLTFNGPSILTLPCGGGLGQFASWNISFDVVTSATDATWAKVSSPLKDFFGPLRQTSAVSSAVIYAVQSGSSCSLTNGAAFFDLSAKNATTATLTIASSVLDSVGSSMSSLTLCLCGSPSLGVELHLALQLSVNGMIVYPESSAGVIKLPAPSFSTVTSLLLTSEGSATSSYAESMTLGWCDTTGPSFGSIVLGQSTSSERNYTVSFNDVTQLPTVPLRVCISSSILTDQILLYALTFDLFSLKAVDHIQRSTADAPLAQSTDGNVALMFPSATNSFTADIVVASSSSNSVLSPSLSRVFLSTSSDCGDVTSGSAASPSTIVSTGTLQSTMTIALPSGWADLSLSSAAALYLCWQAAPFRTAALKPINIRCKGFAVSIANVSRIARNDSAPSISSFVVLDGEAPVALYYSLRMAPMVPAVYTTLALGYIVGSTCVILSGNTSFTAYSPASYYGAATTSVSELWKGQVRNGGSALSPADVSFCVARQSSAQVLSGVSSTYRIVTYSSIGRNNVELTVLQNPSSAASTYQRVVPIAFNGLQDALASQLALLPCAASAPISAAFVNSTAVSLTVTTNTFLSSTQLCASFRFASYASLSSYYTSGSSVVALTARVYVTPSPIPESNALPLFSDGGPQTIPLTFSTLWSALFNSSLVGVSVVVGLGSNCASTLISSSTISTMPLNSSLSTRLAMTLPVVAKSLEPSAKICVGLINLTVFSQSAPASMLLPLEVGTAVLLSYVIGGPSNNIAFFGSSWSVLDMVNFQSPVVFLSLGSSSQWLALTSNANASAGLSLVLAASQSASCGQPRTIIATWSEGVDYNTSSTSFSAAAIVSTAYYWLCAQLQSSSNGALADFVPTKIQAQVLSVTSIEGTLPLVILSSAIEARNAITFSASSRVGVAVSLGAERTITVSGSNFDRGSSWQFGLIVSLGGDCSSTFDVTATFVKSTSTQLTFKIPSTALAVTFETVCLRFSDVHGNGVTVNLWLHMYVRVVQFASIGRLMADGSRQSGIVGVNGFGLNFSLFDAQGSSSSIDISSFSLWASNVSSCGRGLGPLAFASFVQLPLTTVSTTGARRLVVPSSLASGTYFICYESAVSTAQRRMRTLTISAFMEPTGMTLQIIDLKIGGNKLGSGNTIGALVNASLDVKATGSYLTQANVWIAVTDLQTCSVATLSGTTAFGNSRAPVMFSGCSGSTSTATVSAATGVTMHNNSMRLCIGFSSSSDTVSSSPVSDSVEFQDSGILYAVVKPNQLYIIQNESSKISYLGDLTSQPVVGMRDGITGTALDVLPPGTVLQAEWIAVVPFEYSTGEVYTITSGEGESSFDFSKAGTPILLRNGKFGVQYILQFSIPSSPLVAKVNSSVASLASCQSSLQWAKYYTDVCTTCPSNAACDGTTNMRTVASYWRHSERSLSFYSCSSPYMADTCIVNTSTGTCLEGHTGPRCSVCLEGYGSAGDFCTKCDSTIVDWIIVLLAGAAVGLVLVVLVLSTLQCKKSDQFPIYIKLLLNHLTVSSTLGEFSTYLTSSLVTLFKIERQASRPSPAFAALSCTIGFNWYQQFIVVVVFPFAVALLMVVFFVVKGALSAYRKYQELLAAAELKRERRKSVRLQRLKSTAGSAVFQRRQLLNTSNTDGTAADPKPQSDAVLTLTVQAPTANNSESSLKPAQPAVSLIRSGLQRTSSDVSSLYLSVTEAPLTAANDGDPAMTPSNPTTLKRRDKREFHPVFIETTASSDATKAAIVTGPHEDDATLEAGRARRDTAPPQSLETFPPALGNIPSNDEDTRRSPRLDTINDDHERPLADAREDSVHHSNVQFQLDTTTSPEGGNIDKPFADIPFETQESLVIAEDDEGAADDEEEDEGPDLGILEVHRAVAKQEAIHVFAVSMVIILFTAYPSIIEWCAKTLRCDAIDIGEVQFDGSLTRNDVSYFFFDRSKLCTDSEHRRYQLAGWVLGMVYGFGTPLFAVYLFHRLRRPKQYGGVGRADASRMFTFLIAGYRKEVWWWEAPVMFRKLLLIYIVAFLNNPEQQTMCAFWAISLYFAAHIIVRPYEYEMVDRMERYSLGVICLTLNLSMAYSWLETDTIAGTIGFWVLSIFLFAINLGIIAWMLKEVAEEATLKVQKILYAKRGLIEETCHSRIATIILSFAYKPPEVVELTQDGELHGVDGLDDLSAEEQQAVEVAEESGSDWSDDDSEFILEEEEAREREAEAAAHHDLDQLGPSTSSGGFDIDPNSIQASSVFSTPSKHYSSKWGGLKARLKSLSNIGARGAPMKHTTSVSNIIKQRSMHNMTGQQQQQVIPMDVATSAAQSALSQIESAVQARSNAVVTNLKAVIDGMQEHTNQLVQKYAETKELLTKREDDLAQCKKRGQALDTEKRDAINRLKEHAQRLEELEGMASALHDENEALKRKLQHHSPSTVFDRSQSPTSAMNMLEMLSKERQELLARLAEKDMAFSVRDPLANSVVKSSVAGMSVEEKIKQLAAEAEKLSATARDLAEAERDAQLKAIEEQLKQKREARRAKNRSRESQASQEGADAVDAVIAQVAAKGEVSLAPSLATKLHVSTNRRKSAADALLEAVNISAHGEESDEEDPFPPDPNSGGAALSNPLNTSRRISQATSMLQEAVITALQGRSPPAPPLGGSQGTTVVAIPVSPSGNRFGSFRPFSNQRRRSSTADTNSRYDLAQCFPDEEYRAMETDDQGRVLIIRRKHPKMRPPEFVAPWGHATFELEPKKRRR